jgi:hypothetical protein
MSIVVVENTFKNDLEDFFISDFILDSEDVIKVVQNTSLNLYSIKNPKIKINVIKLVEYPNHKVSSFIISKNDFNDNDTLDWKLLEKIEIDNCLILLLSKEHTKLDSLDEWLDECRTMRELYNVIDDGRICISSGFGPGIYSLYGIKNEHEELIAIKMIFIKETV